MAFTTKVWQDSPSTSTPISAAALVDLETRLSGYTDAAVPGINPVVAGIVGSSTNLLACNAVVVQGKYAYTVSGPASGQVLSVIDISRPGTPVILGTLSNAALATSQEIDIAGNYVYVASRGATALSIVDVSNPHAPTLVGSLVDATHFLHAYGVQAAGRVAYVTGQSANTLSAVDISNPAAPTLISALVDATNLFGATQIRIQGHYAFVSCYDGNRVTCVDISNPASMTVVSSLVDATFLFGANALDIAGRYAYVAAQAANRLTIVDISNPAAMTVVGNVIDNTNLNNPYDVQVAGDYAYLPAHQNSGMAIVNISNPASPTVAGHLTGASMSGAAGIALFGPYAIVTGPSANAVTIIGFQGLNASLARLGNIDAQDINASGEINTTSAACETLEVGFNGINSQGPIVSSLGVSAFGHAPPATQTTGGALTAAATYSTNEQTMLQAAYNALRAHGLLS